MQVATSLRARLHRARLTLTSGGSEHGIQGQKRLHMPHLLSSPADVVTQATESKRKSPSTIISACHFGWQ